MPTIIETKARVFKNREIPYLITSLEIVSLARLHIATREPILKNEASIYWQLFAFDRGVAGKEGHPKIEFSYQQREGGIIEIEGNIEQAIEVLFKFQAISQETVDSFNREYLILKKHKPSSAGVSFWSEGEAEHKPSLTPVSSIQPKPPF